LSLSNPLKERGPWGKSITDLSSVTTVGVDFQPRNLQGSAAQIPCELAKHVFQVHCVDDSGRVIVARALRRKNVLPSSPDCQNALLDLRLRLGPLLGA
jgi:transposase